MKIALVIQTAERRKGGAEQYTVDLARALAGRGHEVTVVAERGEAAEGEPFVRRNLGGRGATRWGRLKDFLRRVDGVYGERGFDVVHAMLPVWRCDVYQAHSGLAAELVAAGHLKHPNRLMQALSRVANRVSVKRTGLARVERAMMEKQPWVLCFSKAMASFAREHFGLPEERLVMLMNGIDLGKFDPATAVEGRRAVREKWKILPGQVVGLLMGHNWKLKGVHAAIDALRDAGDTRAVLMVAGKDDPRAYQKHAASAGVAERVIFTGRVSEPQSYYAAADYFILPTRRDTCSLAVLEALVMGVPVITTRQNGASEAMGAGGVITERGDRAALAAAVREMLDDGRRAAMARAAVAKRGELSFEQHVTIVESVYRRVVDERRHGVGHVTAGKRAGASE